MDGGAFEIFGTRYYTNCFGILYIVPFALWFVGAMIRVLMRALEGKPVKWFGPAISAGCILAMLVAVFWDVYQIGQEATRLCNEKAGLHVYRTVEAESVVGLFDIKHWSKYGFKFVEYKSVLNKKTRHFLDDEKPKQKEVDKFLSRYELTMSRSRISSAIDLLKIEVKDRFSDELLGESLEYSIDGGWADMSIFGMTGFTFSPWICSGKDRKRQIYPSDVVEATIRPIKTD